MLGRFVSRCLLDNSLPAVNMFSHPRPSSRPSRLRDEQLFTQVQQGDAEAFRVLVARHQRAMLRVAISRLGRADWAEEALQETWLAAFRSAHTFRPQFALRTWLWTILLNECKRIGKRHADRQAFAAGAADSPAESLELPAAEPSPVAQAIANERRRMLDRALSRLPQNEADALRLRFFGGMTFAEISETMGGTLLTAKNRVKRGLMRLAELQQIRVLDVRSRNEPVDSSVKAMAANHSQPIFLSPGGSGEAT